MSNFTKLNCGLKRLLLSAVFFYSFLVSYSQSIATYWQYNRPAPIGYDITDICYVNNTVGYASGSSGTISRTTDAGRTWMHDYLPGRPFINAITFPSEKVGYVVTSNGNIAKTTNRGISWAFITSPTTATLNNLYFISETTGFIVGSPTGGAATIWKTTDGGTSWTSLASAYPVQNRNIMGIAFLDANIGYTCGQSGHVAKTTDGGTTWTNVSFVSGNPANPGTTTTILSQTYAGIAVLNAQTVVVSSQNNSYIVKTINGGTNWVCKAAQNGTASIIVGSQQMLNMVSRGNDMAVTVGAGCGVSHDAGETWTFKRPFPLGNYKTGLGFTSIAMTPDRGIKMAGGYGVMVDSVSGSAEWDTSYYKNLTYHPASNRAILGISALDKNKIVASGSRGILYTTADGGKNWDDKTILDFQAPAANPEIDIKDVKYVAADALYMCATNGYVYRSLDGGNTWPENLSDPYYFNTNGSALSMDFIDKNTGWVCGGVGSANSAYIYRTTDGGLTWTKQTTVFTGAFYIYSVDFVNATTGWASGTGGRIYKTTDGGNNWVLQTVPGTFTGNSFSIAFATADTGWAVTIGGTTRIIYTTDGGTTWTGQAVSTGVYNKVMAINGKIAVAFGNGGVCLKTIDAGTTWTDFAAPSSDALLAATYIAPYNSISSGVNPADVEMFVGGGKATGAQSPTILSAKLFYTAPAPPAPVITNVTDKCPSNPTSKGKIMNLPPYTQVNITVDGEQVLYSPQDSTFIYFENGITTLGSHAVAVTFTNNGGTSTNTVNYSVRPVLTPAVSIASNDADNIICQGGSITFTATPVNGGTAPTYQWRINGVNVFSNSNTFTYTPANNDIVSVVMTSNYLCVTAATATSTGVTIEVPSLQNTITSSLNVLTATSPNSGTATYQWYSNGQAIPGATSLTYTASLYGTYSIQETFKTCSKQSNQIVIGPNSASPVIVFPSPADRVLNIKSGSAARLISKIGIYDLAGRLYISHTNTASNYFQIDVSKLITGMYIIKFETTQGIFEKMFMKK